MSTVYLIEEDKISRYFADSEETLYTFVIEYFNYYSGEKITIDSMYSDLSEVNLDDYQPGSHFMIESPNFRNWKLFRVTESRSWTLQKTHNAVPVKELKASIIFNVNGMGIEKKRFFSSD